MSCDLIRLAMAGFDACEPTLDGSRIATHCLYPSFESVHVYVVKEGGTFVVHDAKGAFNSAWGHARDEKIITAALDKEALRYHLRNDGNRLVTSDVPGDWLRPAILAVANASAAAATNAVARVVAVADEALVAKIDKTVHNCPVSGYYNRTRIRVALAESEASVSRGTSTLCGKP